MAEANDRIEPRIKAQIRVRLRDSGPDREACILDISSRGLLLTAARPPVRGEIVELVTGADSLVGQIKWTSDRRFGIVLRERIDVMALIANGVGQMKPFGHATARPIVLAKEEIAEEPRDTAKIVRIAIIAIVGMILAYFFGRTIGSEIGGFINQMSEAFEAGKSQVI